MTRPWSPSEEVARHPGDLVIIGAGGHARVVADAWEAAGGRVAVCVEDEGLDRDLGWARVVGSTEGMDDVEFVVAIGDNLVRRKRYEEMLRDSHSRPTTVVHPTAVVSCGANLGAGCMVLAGAVLNPGTEVGEDTILNTGAIVEHDCVIGAHAHVAPRSVLGGGVTVGDGSLVGIGACVMPGVSIGAGATVGAGAVVTRDVPALGVVVGVPASRLGPGGGR